MARKQIKPRTTEAKTAANIRAEALMSARDLAHDTRGMIQFLDDVLTTDRDTLVLSYNALDGLGSFLRIIDANLLGIVQGIAPLDHRARDVSAA